MIFTVHNISTHIGSSSEAISITRKVFAGLKSYLRIRVPGYQYVPSYRAHNWDGYRYFLTSSGVFATGFFPLVYKYLREEFPNVTCKVLDLRTNIPKLNEQLETVLPNGWQLRDYQIDLIKKVNNYCPQSGLYFPRGIIDAATNAGKNSICAGIFQNVNNAKILFLLHSTEIYRQAVEFFGALYPDELGQISQGYFKINNFTIAMAKTLYNKMSKSVNVCHSLQTFNILIVDEAHKAGGLEYSKLLQMLNMGMRVFVSGTPLSNFNKVNNMIIIGLSGTVLGRVENKELIDDGFSALPKVRILLNHTRGVGLTYLQELKTFIHFSENRANLIANICIERSDKKILVAFITKKHGWYMHKVLTENKKFSGNAVLVHGTDAARFYKVRDFKEGKIDVLFTSTILKEGVNIPNIDVLILATGGKSTITVKQFVGRALRTNSASPDNVVEIIDFYDVGEHLSGHSRKRISIYKKEGFDVSLNYKEKNNKPINLYADGTR